MVKLLKTIMDAVGLGKMVLTTEVLEHLND